MVNVYPDYYKSFCCIADKCKHNCCIGWEIDIDEEAYRRYICTEGELGKRLKENISHGNEPHFILKEGGRCPFLNSSGLCDLILEKGEAALCNICRDHPRFRNFFDGVTEIGIGLACEEAARIILSEDNGSFEAVGDITEDAEYYSYYLFRKRIFDVIRDRETGLEERIGNIEGMLGVEVKKASASQIGELLFSLEILNGEWKVITEKIKSGKGCIEEKFRDEEKCERLLCYFIFRHLADGYFRGDIIETILFSILSTRIINFVCHITGLSYEEAARIYSSEIEYSADNTEALISFAGDCYVL